MGKLKALQIKNLPAGNHLDGDRLYLRVKPSGARSWVFRYRDGGRVKELGLGSANESSTVKVSLAQARIIAADMRKAIHAGIDPKSILSPKKQSKTFQAYAEELIESKKAGWRNVKHGQQWINTLSQYVYPSIGSKQIHQISLLDVVDILKPLWIGKTETASRLRSRIEAVIDYGFLHEGIDDKANPARWRGCLDKIFSAPKKVKAVSHFHAIHYDRLPEVMSKLREKTSMSALCCRWITLTASRSNESRGMTWSEIDQEKGIWTVPAVRTKTGREHRIPLTGECVQILQDARELNSKSDFVFSNDKGRPLSDVSVSKTLKAVSTESATIHGLRSSFRDWSAEQTSYPREICEAALAHVVGAVEAAYRRSDLFEKRRELMAKWSDFLAKKI